jgi:hypothetical protein
MLWRREKLFPLPGIETQILGRPARSMVIILTTPFQLLNDIETNFKEMMWTVLNCMKLVLVKTLKELWVALSQGIS